MVLQTPTNLPGDERPPPRRPRMPSEDSLFHIVVIAAAIVMLALIIGVLLSTVGDGGSTPSSTTRATTTIAPTSTPTTQRAATQTTRPSTAPSTSSVPSTAPSITAAPTTPASTARPTTIAPSSTAAPSSSALPPTTATPTTATPTTATPTTPPPIADRTVIWPAPGSGTSFATPEEAARSLAEAFIGLTDPVLGDFEATDNRSGEIQLRPDTNGPLSTILLRQIGSETTWSVTAVLNENIVIDEPRAGDKLANPAVLRGRARAFEGHVDVMLYAHGESEPIATGFVTGRGDGVLGPFDSTIDWPTSVQGTGVLVMTTASGDDGSIRDVAAVPVRFS